MTYSGTFSNLSIV